MKRYRKTFGERPVSMVVNATKVFFNQEGFAEVDEDVASTLELIPGYEFVAVVGGEGVSNPKGEKTPEEPVKASEEEEPSETEMPEEESDDSEEAPKMVKKPRARKPATPKK